MNQRAAFRDFACLVDPALGSPVLKGARMPSIADELATDLRTIRFRVAESRKYRLVAASFAPMAGL